MRPAPPAPSAVEGTPAIDLLARIGGRRQLTRAHQATYFDSLLLETDSVVRRWPEQQGLVFVVAVPPSDSAETDAGIEHLRQEGHLSGYPSRAESEHDVVENSHASTALSWADAPKMVGMYVHQHWPYHHPYAARTWTVDDWTGYADGLHRLGFNTIMIWPVLETMPEPLTPSDRANDAVESICSSVSPMAPTMRRHSCSSTFFTARASMPTRPGRVR